MSNKRHKGSAPPGVQLGLIITPMLDMSFQILAFFIMTYHPSSLEGHIPGNLTPPEDYAKKSKDPVAAPQDPLSLPEDKLDPVLDEAITVQIKAVVKGSGDARREGTPDQIYIRTKLEADGQLLPGSGTDDWDKKVLPELEKKLVEMAKTGKKANLKIAAEGGLEYQYVLSVYDAAKKAGFEKLHFVPPQIKTKLKVDKK